MALFHRLGHSDHPDATTLNNHFERAAEPLLDLDSDFKQMKYFSQTGFFIKPETKHFPGLSYVQRLDALTGSKQNEDGALIDYNDGEQYKTSHLFSKDLSIPLSLYNDDCEIVNPIGSKTSIHKLGLIYFQMRCLPPELLSSLSACFLLAVYKSDDVKTYGIDAVLECIVKDLRDLEQNGIQIETEQFSGTIKVGVAQVCGDNLALNSLVGFSESFVAKSVCRLCKIHKPVLHSQTTEDPNLLRNALNYSQDLQTNNPTETGLKRKCILDELAFFSVVDNVTPDIMHDILEGVGPLEVKLVLSELIAEGHISLDTVNYSPSAEIKKEMALALTAQFPCLKNNEGHGYESWYTPGRYRHPATGYLEERLRNVRKRLKPGTHQADGRPSGSFRFRAPHSQRQHSHPQPSHNSSSRPSFPLPESESSLTELHTMIEWLKNNRSPHSQVEELMIRTAPHRAAWIRSSGTKTVEEINREYPRLYDFPGMISQDFGVLFPDNADRLYEFWAPVFTDLILLFARKEPTAADLLLESLETLSNGWN
ncbi:unnamed protein product [Leuciscus chuanchicus]